MKQAKSKKKIAPAIYKEGDKVVTNLTGNEVLTIDNGAFHNGFTWMYYFKENEMGCGQEYISHLSPNNNTTEFYNRMDEIMGIEKQPRNNDKDIKDELLIACKDLLRIYEKYANDDPYEDHTADYAREVIKKATPKK